MNYQTLFGKDSYVILRPSLANIVQTEEYTIDSDNKIITNIPLNTDKSVFTENLNTITDNYSLKNNKGEILNGNDLVGTGSKLKIGNDEYTIIVKGDLDGSGDISITDVTKAKLHLIKLENIEEPYLTAGYLTKEGELTVTDVVKLKLHLIGLDRIE